MELQGIEIVREVTRGKFKHVLFDFDGTISLLREGWQGIMRPMMAEMIGGDEAHREAIGKRITDFIDETTGLQTILQMEGLVELVLEYGFVPEEEVLDAQGYRRIYNDALMGPLNARIQKLAKGELTRDALSVAGSRAFVAAVAAQGPSLYIFSGTNQADVRNEANNLGVDAYFTDIWGALRTVKEFSKEKILTEMIEKHDLHGAEILIVGDGPVEIRLAHERGCVSLGVASDEANGGLDPVKRARLLGAGADIIVPDFKNGRALVEYLFDP